MMCACCLKRNSRWSKKLKLLLISGNGDVCCRACGYRKYPKSITQIDGRERITKVADDKKAEESFLVCLNCEGAIKSGELRYEVMDIKARPIVVAFYDTRVSIVEVKLTDHIKETSANSQELEVVDAKEEVGKLRSVSRETHRMGGSNPGDLSGMRQK